MLSLAKKECAGEGSHLCCCEREREKGQRERESARERGEKEGSGFTIHGSGLRVQGVRFRVEGSGRQRGRAYQEDDLLLLTDCCIKS
jgi:hypothetical protein